MRFATFMIFAIILVPVLLFAFEFYLCKKKSKFALVLPTIAACCFLLVGFYAIIISAIMFGIYLVVKHMDKEAQSKQSELDKMNILDLE